MVLLDSADLGDASLQLGVGAAGTSLPLGNFREGLVGGFESIPLGALKVPDDFLVICTSKPPGAGLLVVIILIFVLGEPIEEIVVLGVELIGAGHEGPLYAGVGFLRLPLHSLHQTLQHLRTSTLIVVYGLNASQCYQL